MSWDFTGYIDTFTTINEFRKELIRFFELEEGENALSAPVDTAPPLQSIEFENVSFKYPKTEKMVLNNISFKISPNQCYAFVGANGSGKTTIIKLLTGLYDDYSGVIRINGKDIKSYATNELHAIVCVLFQDYAKYQITIKENILLGDINNFDTNGSKVHTLIDAMNLTELINSLPQGTETNIGKIKEDGVELSGGQWQRLSIIRALINRAPLKILDEPTAALDPISESVLYGEFEKLTKNTTTILISHRLGATKLANEIIVIDQGRIVEKGSHEELLEHGNLYADMFNAQKEWYA
jgi:ATP-binding cassette subfamily B protein